MGFHGAGWYVPGKLLSIGKRAGYGDDLGMDTPQEVMMGLMWKKELSVGNAFIDAEHRNLIGMFNDVRHGIKTRNCSALPQAFGMVERWLHTHFANEEKIAQAVGFCFDRHRLAQQHALKELLHLRDELVSKNGIWSDGAANHFVRSLKNWMIDEHILKLDMQMKPALQSYDYHFLPDCGHGEAGHAGEAASPVISGHGLCGCGCDS